MYHARSFLMKIIMTGILWIIVLSDGYAQSVTRRFDEDIDDFVSSLIDQYSIKSGATFEYQKGDTHLIFYFVIKSIFNKPVIDSLMSDLDNSATMTIFYVLYSDDQINYKKAVIDTIDIKSDCCSCDLPATVDSIFYHHIKKDHKIIVLRKNLIKHGCSLMTSHWALVYDDLLENIRSGAIPVKPNKVISYYPYKKRK